VISPQRVIPLSIAATYYPEIVGELEHLSRREWTTYLVGPTDFLIKIKDVNHNSLDENQKQICDALGDRP